MEILSPLSVLVGDMKSKVRRIGRFGGFLPYTHDCHHRESVITQAEQEVGRVEAKRNENELAELPNLRYFGPSWSCRSCWGKGRFLLKLLCCDPVSCVTAKLVLRRKYCWLGKRLEGLKWTETERNKDEQKVPKSRDFDPLRSCLDRKEKS